EDPQTQLLWADLDASLRISMQHLRESIWALSAASITLLQLADRIRLFGQKRFTASQTHFSLTSTEEPLLLKPDQALALYRIAQEALNNAAKYANASRVTLQLTAEEGMLQMVIADDGLGFDAALLAEGSYGLSNMRARVQELGGTFTLTSAPGAGTRLQVQVPI
ncbi:MAG: hypothetical protein KF690_11520, partial [Bacteroidetes bacterium]|nr:hypothetical protein [Bacteroidota bacterium]